MVEQGRFGLWFKNWAINNDFVATIQQPRLDFNIAFRDMTGNTSADDSVPKLFLQVSNVGLSFFLGVYFDSADRLGLELVLDNDNFGFKDSIRHFYSPEL